MKNIKITFLALLLLLCVVIGYADPKPLVESLQVNPNPMYKQAVLTVNANTAVQATIVIETLGGEQLKTIFVGILSPGQNVYCFDRYDDAGTYLPDGNYAVSINFTGRYTSTKKTIILK